MKSRWLIGLAVVALLAPAAFAQQNTGDIYGTVMDETGGVLPGVTVTLTGQLIGTMTQTTGLNGDFHFIRLSPGDYDVQCELEGFTTYVQKLVAVQTGGAVNLKITLKPTTVAETITVTAEQPILDTKKTGVGQNMTNEILANIPTARDPWVVMSMVSGIIVDRVNIGGAEGGQQSEFTSRGDSGGDNAMWNMDGVTITDMAAVGSSPTYYDFDAFEEIQVTTGGNDPSQATGGMGVNFVTKRGGDTPKGSARFITTSEGLQSDNTKDLHTPDHGGAEDLEGYKWNPTYKRVNMIKLRDYGIEIGGPIMKEKAWYWGAVGLQDIQTIQVNGAPDNTQLENISFKVNAQATQDLSLTYMYYRGDKVKRGRNAGATRPTETTWNQSGPTNIHKVEVSNIINPNLYINGKFGITLGGFHLVPTGGLEVPQVWRDPAGTYHNSFQDYFTDRPGWQLSADSNYFMTAGGNHEFKFGFTYRIADVESITQWPGEGVVADEYYGIAWITRASHQLTRNTYLSFYGGDTWTLGRATLNLGVRFDQQKGTRRATSTPASPNYPNILPGINVTEQATPFTWNDISPRLGFTYDLLGDGKTIVRASFARYADQLSAGDVGFMSPINAAGEIDYLWTDLNGNHYADADEIDFAYGPVGIYYVDPLDPTSSRSTTAYNADLTAPKRLEFIVGGEREIMQNFALGGNFVWRKADNIVWRIPTNYKDPSRPWVFEDYQLAGAITGVLPDGTPYAMPYYRLDPALAGLPGAGVDYLYDNRADYNQKYYGFELFATKRLSNKWMMNASFNYQRNRYYATSNAGIGTPNNFHDGEDLAFQSASSGKAGYWIGTPKWQFLVNGMYQFPYQISASANVIAREGFPVAYMEIQYRLDPATYATNLRAQDMGESKLPNMVNMDFRVSKAISLGDKGNVSLDLDVFNLFNKNTPLHVFERLKRTNTNEVQDLMYPRIVRFGVRYSF